jgi:hypothetical protein
LIVSLSFVPSVNASSDIFDEPRHIDYNTYKERMVEYIETPDYLKPSMPSIIGKNEYVDISDIVLASNDLLSVLPVISNESFDEIKKTSSFKSLNTILSNEVESIIETRQLSVDELPDYLNPRGTHLMNPAAYHTFARYLDIASYIKNIFTDSNFMMGHNLKNPFMSNDRVCDLGNVKYTFAELSDRIAGSYIDSNGNFVFSNTDPLASQIVPPVEGAPPAPPAVGPEKVSVNEVCNFISNKCFISPSDNMQVALINAALTHSGGPDADIVPVAYEGSPFKTGGRSPKLLMDRSSEKAAFLDSNRGTQGIYDHDSELRTGYMGEDLNIKEDVITQSATDLGITMSDSGEFIVSKRGIEDIPDLAPGFIEGGVFFILAIVSLVLACVYK